MPPPPPDQPSLAAPRRYGRREVIFLEGEPADYVYLVAEGAARMHRTTRDGRRQILGFACPGEWLGVASEASYSHTAEALVAARVSALARAELLRRLGEDGAFARFVYDLAVSGLRQTEDQILMMGRKCALERVATFLVSYGARSPGRWVEDASRTGWEVHLPMDRLDIADFLGLTIETVSRKFTRLKLDGVIGLTTPSRVRVLRPERLIEIAACDANARASAELIARGRGGPASRRALVAPDAEAERLVPPV